MNRLMAGGTPAGPSAEKRRVIAPADEDPPRRGLLLEMALEAKGLIARHQQALIHRTVRLVAGGAAFAQRLVLEHKRAELHRVAFAARFILRQQGRPTALHGRPFVRIMAISATDLPFQNRVMVRQVELSALVQVTLETGLRRSARINDGVARATGLIVQAAGAVAGLAADVLGVVSGRLQPGVSGGLEIARDGLVALRTGLRTDEFSPGNARRRHHGPGNRGAGDRRGHRRQHAGNNHQPPAVDVSLPRITVLRRRLRQ